MRILVTGGSGFIGSHVVDRFLSLGHEVAVVDNLSTGHRENLNPKARFYETDIRDTAMQKVFEEFRPEVVDHHAAQMSVPASVDDPIFDAQVNLIGLLNLLESARKVGTRKFVFASSGGTVYGEPPDLPCREDHAPLPASPYGITKHTSEHYLGWYAAQHGIEFTALRYANVYGPRQLPHGEAGVVAIFFLALLQGRAPTIFGDGKFIRDYVFVGDVVDANEAALTKGRNDAVNIGTGIPTDTNQLYAAVAEAAGSTVTATRGPARRGDIRASWLAIGKAKAVLGWAPATPLSEGLRRTLEFFQNRART